MIINKKERRLKCKKYKLFLSQKDINCDIDMTWSGPICDILLQNCDIDDKIVVFMTKLWHLWLTTRESKEDEAEKW